MGGSNFDLEPQEWATLRGLLDTALDLPVAARDDWVEQLNDRYAGFKPRLRALLAHAESPEVAALLDTLPKVETDQFAPPLKRGDADALTLQTQIGPYRLLRQLGEGGMATVWLAERTDVLQGRKVALKLPHGAWRRAGLADRMAREREILATLEHPNIARLYDAGLADDGQPYLAIEYVEGQSIDRYCREHALDVRNRIGLFLQVTQAVAYAHANLVVHRDLKPSNILVTADGAVRLLDFGIAKLVEQGVAEETELTREVGRALTLDYAAPEQIQGRPVGTAADIYSLGVVLFELLSGHRPYALDRKSPAALEEAILRTEIRRPSAAADDPARQRELRGDLDTIVLKALKTAAEDRYETVNAMADDLRRHLEHRPLMARPDSGWVQLRKFVLRHRVGTAAAAVVAISVLAGTAVAVWQAEEARVQRDAALLAKSRADQEARAARVAERNAGAEADLSSFLLSDLATGNGGDRMLAQLERAIVMVRAQYRGDPGLRGRMLLGIGQQFRWISEHVRADAVFAEAEPLLRTHGDPGDWSQLMCLQASARARSGLPDEALDLLARAARANPMATTGQIWARAECLQEEALISRFAGNPARAVSLTEQALALAQRVGRDEREDYSEVLNALARAEIEDGRFGDAAAAARRSIALLERIGRSTTPGYFNAWGVLAQALRDGGRPLDAERAHGTDGRLDPTTDAALLPLRSQYALTLVHLQRHDKAVPLLDQLIELNLAEGNPTQARYMLLHKAYAMIDLGRLDKARQSLARAEPLFAAARAKHQPQARSMSFAIAHWAVAAEEWNQAQASIDESRALLERPPRAPEWVWRPLHRLTAQLALGRGDASAALISADRALALSRGHAIDPGGSLGVAEDLLLRARVRLALHDTEGARADFTLAASHARSAAGDRHPVTLSALASADLIPPPRAASSPPGSQR